MIRSIKVSRHAIRPLGVGVLIAITLFCAFAVSTVMPAKAASPTLLIQQNLAGLSYMPMSGIDGVAGPNTTAAIKHFQEDNALTADGIAGTQTTNTLDNKVKEVQRAASITADGAYGSDTITAVKTYQSAHQLQVDGIAGPQTMGEMNILRRAGSTSGATSDIHLLQQNLAGLGYLSMSGIDGIYGPRTRNAVLSFQSDVDIQADGIAGPQTMDALGTKVKEVQHAVSTTADGAYGSDTITAVKTYQGAHQLQVDGIAGPQTMAAMGVAREVGGGSGGSGSGGSPNPPPVQGSTVEKILQAARSQLGVHEWGNNCNPYGPCEPWCALFASWTWRQGGVNFSTSFSGSFYSYGTSHNTLHSGLSHPQPGDAILFGTGPQNTSTSVHVGIIEQVLSNGTVISIEGNHSNQVERVGPYSPSIRGAYAIVSP